MLCLSKYVGKKLMWVGNDGDEGTTILLFEGFGGFSISEDNATEIVDGRDVASKLISEKLDVALNVVKLKEILEATNGRTNQLSGSADAGTGEGKAE
jgi:hypothetical protein